MAASIKTPLGNAPLVPVMIVMIGGYLAWFGAHYFKSDTKWPTDPIKSALSGGTVPTPTFNQEQAQQANVSAYVSSVASGGSPGTGSSSGATGNSIADAALKYVGQGYVYGGNASKPGDWDCSSFVSYVLGHDLGMALPGGNWGSPGFPPSAHGPTTSNYLLFGTAENLSSIQPGDLLVWSTHMGIATSSTEMVAAQSTATGTGTSSIAGTTSSLGEGSPNVRRVAAPLIAGIGGVIG